MSKEPRLLEAFFVEQMARLPPEMDVPELRDAFRTYFYLGVGALMQLVPGAIAMSAEEQGIARQLVTEITEVTAEYETRSRQ